MAAEALGERIVCLGASEGALSGARRRGVLADCNAVSGEVRKETDVRFHDATWRDDERRFPLRSGAEHPFDDAAGLVRATLGGDFEFVSSNTEIVFVPVFGFP